jgi:hypothetical protein
MVRKSIVAIVSGLAAFFGALDAPLAQSPANQVDVEGSASDGRWTVLTMAPDGSWGAATESMSNRAIANAIAECKFMSRTEIGCGAYMISIQRGWILAFAAAMRTLLQLPEISPMQKMRLSDVRSNFGPAMCLICRLVSAW